MLPCAGKTTLLRMIAGLESTSSGSIHFDGAHLSYGCISRPLTASLQHSAASKAARLRSDRCHVADTDATSLSVQDRGVGFVFQSYALSST